ncbi:MAG TPA: sugar ABC transporter permease [Firmicutes bacterium]|nr:sugar ABC transporter permease [Bacillota bacterium]
MVKDPGKNKRLLWREVRRNKVAYLFISPFYIMFLLFMVLPVVYSFYLSLTDVQGIGMVKWVGLRNYINLFQDERFLQAIKNTSLFAVVQIPIMLTLAVILALILNSKRVFLRNLFRSVYFLPVVMSLAVAALAFSMILNKDIGLLNLVLSRMGFSPRDWLNDPDLALWSIVGLVTWRWTGYNMVIILAGLQNIPQELLEAAQIDGAGPWQRLRHITLPLIWPVVFFCLILSMIGAYQLFEEPMILTKGGPMDRTLTIVLYLYQTGFQKFQFGYASAIAYSLVIILLVVSGLQMKLSGGLKD